MSDVPETPQARAELLATVASLYYLDGLDQGAIAEKVSMSRSTVSRMVNEARRTGIVRIHVEWPLPRRRDLEQRLIARFGIAGALVVGDPVIEVDIAPLIRVARIAARYLEEHLPPDGVLAITWGTSVAAVADAISTDTRRHNRVVQMIGASGSKRPGIDGAELARTFATQLGGDYRPLDAPLVVDHADLAAALLRQPTVASVLEEARTAAIAVIGLGGMDPEVSSLLRSGFASRNDLAEAVAAGVVGDAGGHLLNAVGEIVETPFSRRMVRLDEQSLRQVPTVLAVAIGAAKVSVVRASLASGLVDVLATDESTALAVLRGETRKASLNPAGPIHEMRKS